MNHDYDTFVAGKLRPFVPCGREVRDSEIHPSLFPFQRALVRWACRMGRAAIFADCGLGKSRQQVEWARMMGQRVLIFAPLTVAEQTIAEAAAIGVEVRYVRTDEEMGETGIYITNYDRFERFRYVKVDALVLDESSILKSCDGKIRNAMLHHYQNVPHRLCCTATPAPNDITEIANHAEFLGVKSRVEMLATFFVHDADGWRLKKHAEREFYRWMASWAVYVRKPSDLGYDDTGYDLPDLHVRQATVESHIVPDGHLFPATVSEGIVGRSRIRRETLESRVAEAVRLVQAEPDQQWIVWCGLNDESDAIARALPDCVQVEGRTDPDDKIARLRSFLDGTARVLVTKPTVAGFGMNFQHSARMVFCGIGDSWEQYYQCLRRCWRFGQEREVHAWIVASDAEEAVVANVMRKEEDAKKMGDQILEHLGELERAAVREGSETEVPPALLDEARGEKWRLIHGDCVEALGKRVAADSVDLSVFSPPFATLYTYSDSPRDMGNSRDHDEFFEHFGFFVRELYRVTKPGRIACLHVAQVGSTLNTDGVIGIKDFRGRTIDAMIAGGWVHHGEVCIDKCPQALMDGTPVLTPNGWKRIEDCEVGSFVIGSDGKPTRVTGRFPQGERELYRVVFNDGAEVLCDGNHLWNVAVNSRANGPWRTMRTTEILEAGVKTPSGRPKWTTPIVAPVEFAQSAEHLPLDPYLLGVLIGDGSLSQDRVVEVCTDAEIAENLPLPDRHQVVRREGSDRADGTVASFGIVCEDWHRNDVLSGLRELGLQGKRAWEKFIPNEYLRASIAERRALLAGLLDTDGTCKRGNSLRYSTTSRELATDVRNLVGSLGGIATITESAGGAYRWKDEDRQGRPLYTVTLRLPFAENPFRLARKAHRWTPAARGYRRLIDSITPAFRASCTCISVEAEDGLYVTTGHVVTHNSQAIRTHAKALLFVQKEKDRSWSRPALPDYILVFRKPGDNAVPIRGDVSNEDWIQWARPIWYGIKETDTLNVAEARSEKDERHICPLQLGVIERCVRLWSNPGETVLSPFAGIGSEGYQSILSGRRFVGVELKPEYWQVACRNLARAERAVVQPDLFTELQEDLSA